MPKQFKVNRKDTGTKLIMSLWCLYCFCWRNQINEWRWIFKLVREYNCYLWAYFRHWPGASLFSCEQVNYGWAIFICLLSLSPNSLNSKNLSNREVQKYQIIIEYLLLTQCDLLCGDIWLLATEFALSLHNVTL